MEPSLIPWSADWKDASLIAAAYSGSFKESLTFWRAPDPIPLSKDLRLAYSYLSIELSMLTVRPWKWFSSSVRELVKKLTKARFFTKSYSLLRRTYSICSFEWVR